MIFILQFIYSYVIKKFIFLFSCSGGTVDPKTRELLDNDKLISEITQRMGLLNLFVVK